MHSRRPTLLSRFRGSRDGRCAANSATSLKRREKRHRAHITARDPASAWLGLWRRSAPTASPSTSATRNAREGARGSRHPR
ncbi:Uncharacterised protein [Mycobacteroides abscessus]|nr:Uncharacterised protein [Mycobacteroides abscessus]